MFPSPAGPLRDLSGIGRFVMGGLLKRYQVLVLLLVGPEPSQMGPMNPPQYFAQSIMHPDVVVKEDRYRAEDGGPKMTNFNDFMTVEERIDLTAFLKSLGGEHSTPSQDDHGH